MKEYLKPIWLAAYLATVTLTSAEGTVPTIADVDRLFQIGDSNVNIHDNDRVILLVGGTGTGKSTLSKFMRRDQSLKIAINKADDLVFDDGEKRIGNQNTLISKTLFPHVDTDSESGALVVDCAGFGDTRHPLYDLLASFLTQKVFQSSHRMKIVVVETYEHLRPGMDRSGFSRTIKQLAHVLQNNVGVFNGSVALVGTKAESTKSDERLVRSVHLFLQETIEFLTQKQEDAKDTQESQDLLRQILLVRFLSSNVAIFRRPDDEASSPWNLPSLAKNFAQVRDLVFNKLRYSLTTGYQFKIAVAAGTVVYIQNQLLAVTKDTLQEQCSNVGRRLIIAFDTGVIKPSMVLYDEISKPLEYANHYAYEMAQVNSVDSLLAHCRNKNIDKNLVDALDLQVRKAEFYCNVANNNFLDVQKGVVGLFGAWQSLQNRVNKAMHFLTFSKTLFEQSGKYEIYSQKPFSHSVTLANFADFLSHILNSGIDTSPVWSMQPNPNQLMLLNRIVTETMDPAVKEDLQVAHSTYTGHYVLASQIKNPDLLRGNLIIVALQKFFVDADLSLTDCHLTIVAPVVEVIGAHRVIVTTGSSGSPPAPSAAPEGTNGEAGNPGFSSGDVNVYALSITNAAALEIRSVGGSGSNGQNGGQGRDGKASAWPGPADFHGEEPHVHQQIVNLGYSMTVWNRVDRKKKNKIFLVYNEQKDKVYVDLEVQNTQGLTKPTDGGHGGKGGAGASSGDLNIVLKAACTRVQISKTNGRNGGGGKAGHGGASVPKCAMAKYSCEGSSRRKDILGFIKISDKPYDYHCQRVSQFYCSTSFDSLNGNDGVTANSAEIQTYKFQSVALEGVRKFKEAAAMSQSKGGSLAQFLDFISQLSQR